MGSIKKSPNLPVTRKKSGKKFVYYIGSKQIKAAGVVERINKLRIPPAWKDVAISAIKTAKLQATGFDARGRKQYIYNARFVEKQSNRKYLHILEFAKALPEIRKRVKSDLARKNLDKQKVLAAIVRLTEMTLIRVGNDEYAKSNKSFGLTTFTSKHVKVTGGKIQFKFLGKSKKEHSIKLTSKKLSKILKKCHALGGKELFQYQDESGKLQDIKSLHVNSYLRQIGGGDFTVKDFRTWAGTVLAVNALNEVGVFDTKTAAKKGVTQAIDSVASKLGNTPAVCRSSYIHPVVIKCYLNGVLLTELKRKKITQPRSKYFSSDENFVLKFLKKNLGSK